MPDSEKELSEFLNTIPQPMSQADLEAQLKAEQASLSREEIVRKAVSGTLPVGRDAEGETIFAPKAEAVFDPETAEKPTHNWVDRGEVMSCEGAGHANHRHFKVRARR